LANIKSEQHAQLRTVAAGIDPVLVRELVEDLQREEREIRDQLRGTERPGEAVRALAAIRRLREHAGDLRAVLSHGVPEDQPKIFSRTILSVTWLPEEERLELRLVLPEAEDESAEGVLILYVPGVGFEPTWSQGPAGFKPAAAAEDFATRAKPRHYTWWPSRCSDRDTSRSARGSSDTEPSGSPGGCHRVVH
jgi:hypothetical protein